MKERWQQGALQAMRRVGVCSVIGWGAACASGPQAGMDDGSSVPLGAAGAAGAAPGMDAAGAPGVAEPLPGAAGGSAGAAPGKEATAVEARERCEASVTGPALLRRLTHREYERTLRAAFPTLAQWAGVRLGVDPSSHTGFSNDAATLVVGLQTAREIQQTAEEVADQFTSPEHLAAQLPCSTASQDVACAEPLIGQTGAALYRRPLTPVELQEYVALFTDIRAEAEFAVALKWTLSAMMQAPAVVYRSEIGVADAAGRTLTDHELAQELAYNFSGGPPSAALVARAVAGELRDPATRVAVAQELLATPEGRELVQRFFGQWLGYEQVIAEVKTAAVDFDAVRPLLGEETRRFIDEVIYAQSGSVLELLTAPFTVLSPELATFYGYGAGMTDWAVVPRPPGWGVGLLAQGSLLATYANSAASSPTQRGLIVYEKLLCNTRPPVPANVPNLESTGVAAQTTRERYESVHAANPPCSNCHALFDPLGFAFEHFDEVGRYRAQENGVDIDATGAATLADGTELTFDGLDDLATKLAGQPSVTDCASGLGSVYFFGGAGGTACVAEQARARLASGDVSLLDFFAELAAEPHATSRTAF